MGKNVFREARIVLPMRADAKALAEIEARLVAAFGGFTSCTGTGAWRAPDGFAEVESIRIYDIAVPAFDAGEPERAWLGSEITLREIARDAARMLAQECVYARMPFGDVYLIRPDGCSYNADAASAPHPRASEFWRMRNAGMM
jgi:hypothetical protein